MLCTFCGTDNRPENKFCGMCGVRLERRKVERRVHQPSVSTKCPSCEHVNEQGYKFCAMCGARVDRRVNERRADHSESPRATAVANVRLPGPEGPPVATAEAEAALEQERKESPQPVAPKFPNSPAPPSIGISGPSFLGLNEESESVDYLFEEEGRSRGILSKLVLLAVLAAAGGLIFIQWRAGFPLLHAIQRSIHSANVEPGSSLPEQNQDSPPATTETGALNSEAGSVKEPSGTAKQRVPDLAPLPKANTPPLEAQATPASSGRTTEPVATSDRSKLAKDDQDKPSQMLQRAQQYLEGTGGFAQNCDQGLVYLRAAAKSEAAAAAQMGVLYASGHCVQQDRVAAYRWLNSAHELQPGNSQIQANLNQLWAQMTSQERNQVIR